MQIKISRIISLTTILFLISCDKDVGMSGIVVDSETGQRISEVNVKMTSEQGDKADISKANGYFNTYKFFSCGIGNCNTDYKIEFSKTGYSTKLIDENFYSSPEAEFVNPEKKDTLIVKLHGN